jgi:hypothetical protein
MKYMFNKQTNNSKPTANLCYQQPNENSMYTLAVIQYPWHNIDGYILEKRGIPKIPSHKYFTKEVYDLSKKHLCNSYNIMNIDKIDIIQTPYLNIFTKLNLKTQDSHYY